MNKKSKHSNFKLPKKSEVNTGFKIPVDYFKNTENEVVSKLTTEKFSKENNFEIPQDYFSNIEDVVLGKLKAEAIQNNKMDNIPDNYFDTLENRVFAKLNKEKKPKVISLKSISKLVAPIAIAASLLLFIYLNTTSKSFTMDSLSTASIENYFENDQADLNILSIASLYTEDELNEETLTSDITNTEVENYLSEEDLENIIYEN